MSTMRWVREALGPLNTAARPPTSLIGSVMLLARTSPFGTLIVELVGAPVIVGPTETYPAAVWPITVTLPVIAQASSGMAPTPATAKDRGEPVANVPLTPSAL